MKDLKMLLWNTKSEKLEEIIISNKRGERLQEIYKHLKCDLIDITTREINGIRYDIIVNDEGLLIDNYIFTYFENGKPQLAGNLIFSKTNEEGENIGLKEKEIDNLKKNLQVVYYRNEKNEEIKTLNYGNINNV